MNCTVAISGQVISAVQSSDVPSAAPALEYVAMPAGSSSAAPAITPGPSSEKKRRTAASGRCEAGMTIRPRPTFYRPMNADN